MSHRAIAIVVLICSTAFSWDKEAYRERMLPATVKILVGGSSGSGVILYSRATGPGGVVETYILTAYHVVDEVGRVDSLPEGQQKITIQPALVGTYRFDGRNIESTGLFPAYVLWYDASLDVAILKLQSPDLWVEAEMADLSPLAVGDEVVAVGCPLGEDPTFTFGHVQQIDQPLPSAGTFWRVSSDIVFGNSGGGVWTMDGRLIGISTRVRVYGWPREANAVTWLAFVVPVDQIEMWLRREKHDRIMAHHARRHRAKLASLMRRACSMLSGAQTSR